MTAHTAESFRGDFEALAAVIRESWSQGQDQSLSYNEPFLRSALAYPGASFELAPTIYVDGLPAAFVAGFPRTARLNGRDLRLVCLTFWTAAVRFKGKGYGSRIWIEALDRARQAGYDGALNFCVDGARTNEMVVTCGQRVNAQVYRPFQVSYMARLLRPAVAANSGSEPAPIDLFLERAAQVRGSELCRMWSREEAQWQCVDRAGGMSVAEHGSRSGIVTGYVVDTLHSTAKVLLLEDLLWGDLEPAECRALVERLLSKAASAGAQTAVAPLMGYADMEPLHQAGFRRTRRKMNMYLTLWAQENPAPEGLQSVYMDIF